MGELEQRVRDAAMETQFEVRALKPREAVKAEKADRRADQSLEDERCEILRSILASFRGALREFGDIGTSPYPRAKHNGPIRKGLTSLFGLGARGWTVGRLDAEVVLPGPYAGATRRLELTLVMLLDAKLYCGADGVIWDRYRFGQSNHPDMPVAFPPSAWRELEETVPEHVGQFVGVYQLDWQLD
ncbi:MAG: hypothetical protein ACI8Y4_003100 [Candidatus Poriferisodalaceae bacterium]|jgi:hypothetical protein